MTARLGANTASSTTDTPSAAASQRAAGTSGIGPDAASPVAWLAVWPAWSPAWSPARSLRRRPSTASVPSSTTITATTSETINRSVMSPVNGHVIDRRPTSTMLSSTPVPPPALPPPTTYSMMPRVSAKSCVSSWTSSGRNPAAMTRTAPRPPSHVPRTRCPARRRRTTSTLHAHASGSTTTTPRTWHCIVTIAPRPLATHHRACPVRLAITALPKASAAAAGMRLGFQMNVLSSMPAGETAASRPAAAPAIGPPMSRASHQAPATAAMPNSAISTVTATGSAAETAAAGARR